MSNLTSQILELRKTNFVVQKAFSFKEIHDHTYEATLEMIVLSLIDHTNALEVMLREEIDKNQIARYASKPLG